MNKITTFFVLLCCCFTVILFAEINATIYMLNGDSIPCTFLTETIDLITDYGEFSFGTDYLLSIQFPEPGKGVTLLNTIHSEIFRGFVMNELLSIQAFGSIMEIRTAKVSKIEFDDPKAQAKGFDFLIALRNGDAFYGKALEQGLQVQTSYGIVELKFRDIKIISFEGSGNVLSKVVMRDEAVVQGIIKNEFLPIELLSAAQLEIVPDLIHTIEFESDNTQSSPKPRELDKWVAVTGGTFQMGNAANDPEGADTERPAHKVKFTYDFWMGKYEVTFAEYDAFCVATAKTKPDDKNYGRGNRPVILISWADAIKYCNWLSEKEGVTAAYNANGALQDFDGNPTTDFTRIEGYRLPTEAEWEYAAKGGQLSKGFKFSGSNNLTDVGWFKTNSGEKTQEVGKKKANELGLYDMSGNVAEWCYDWIGQYTMESLVNPIGYKGGSKRIVRGGNWYSMASLCRTSSRNSESPDNRFAFVGFRVIRTIIP